MKYNKFEKHIADQFKNQSSDIDVNQLLGKLNLPTESQDERPRFFSWMMFGLGFLGAILFIGSLWLTLDSDESAFEVDYNIDTRIDDNALVDNDESKKSNIDASIEESVILAELEGTQALDFHVKESSSQNSRSKFTSYEDVSPFESKLNNETLDSNIAFDNGKDNVLQVIQDSKTVIDFPKDKSSGNKNITKELDVSGNYFKNNQNAAINQFDVSGINMLDIQTFSLQEPMFNLDLKPVECPQFHREGLNYKVGVEFGYSKPKKKLHPKQESSNDLFVERLENEVSLEGIDFTIFGIVSKKNIPVSIKLGTEYFRLSERLHHESLTTTRDTTVGIISTSVSTTGDTITVVYGDIITETSTKSVNKVHYNINQINFPISMMYDLRFGRNVFQLEGGVNFNIATWSSGLLLTDQEQFISLESLEYFKRNIGMSYFGKINIIRELNRGNSIYISPRFQYNPKDWTSSVNSIGQKYQNFAIRAGMLHQF